MPSSYVIERAHRVLNRLQQYRTLEGNSSQSISTEAKGLLLRPGETIVGIYDNRPSSQDERIVITTIGLHAYLDGSWRSVAFTEVEQNELPHNKAGADTIIVVLKTGGKLTIPIRGGDNKFRDVFEFAHFLDRVTMKQPQ